MIERDRLIRALGKIERYSGNPLISSTSQQSDSANYYGVYNGDVILHEGIYHGVVRCELLREGGSEVIEKSSTVGHYTSRDGYNFDLDKIIICDDGLSIDDPRIFRHNGYFYVASTQVDPEKGKQTLHLTKTKDFEGFEFLGSLPLTDGEPYADHKGIRAFVPVVDENKELVRVNGNYFGYCYHLLRDGRGIMFGFNIENIDDPKSYTMASKEPVMIPKPGTFYGNLVEPGSTPILTDKSIVMVFAGEKEPHGEYCAGVVEFDRDNPTQIIKVHEKAILTPQEKYEIELNPDQDGRDGGIIFPSGICLEGEILRVYYGAADRDFCVATSELS